MHDRKSNTHAAKRNLSWMFWNRCQLTFVIFPSSPLDFKRTTLQKLFLPHAKSSNPIVSVTESRWPLAYSSDASASRYVLEGGLGDNLPIDCGSGQAEACQSPSETKCLFVCWIKARLSFWMSVCAVVSPLSFSLAVKKNPPRILQSMHRNDKHAHRSRRRILYMEKHFHISMSLTNL